MPYEKTVWDFKKRLTNKGLEKDLYAAFHIKLEENGLIAHEGKIIDASFVEVPRQHNTREENKHIKETDTAPKEWGDNPNKKRQKDIDAKWTKKNGQNYSGYKDKDKDLWADSAYTGEEQEKIITGKNQKQEHARNTYLALLMFHK